MTAEATYGMPRTIAPGILHEGSCTFAGRSTWGYRLTCNGCGAVEATPIGSSVSAEDHPPRFAREHRACNPETESCCVTLRRVEHGRDTRESSYLYFDVPTLRRACELGAERIAASCMQGWRVYSASFDF